MQTAENGRMKAVCSHPEIFYVAAFYPLKTLQKYNNFSKYANLSCIFVKKIVILHLVMKLAFDNDKYIRIQSERIRERIAQFGNKLYLEMGGKLFDDMHASRVLPGFMPDSKLGMLTQLRESLEIIIVISAEDIERNKVRQDLGITYDEDVLRLREAFIGRGFIVSSVVITHYAGQRSADTYRQRLEWQGIKVYYHYIIEGYPHNVELIASQDGFGKNDYIETTRPLVVVTAPGGGSGKMAVCLSQLYNEQVRGREAGYAKFETFPVWNLPLKHPLNVAYEAATADLQDVNMIDPFHLEAYGKTAVNYNRDVEIYPVLDALFTSIYGHNPYKSPTDMGVNMVGFCISDDEVCREASKQEIIRRYFHALCRLANGACNDAEIQKLALLQKQVGINTAYRKTVVAARERKEQAGGGMRPYTQAAAIELPDGRIITADASPLLGSSAALLINVMKELAGIDHAVKLIPQNMIEPIQHTKIDYLHGHNPRLHTDEVLVALSVLSPHDDNCRRALATLPLLKGCQAHSTVMLKDVDLRTFAKLGIELTSDPALK